MWPFRVRSGPPLAELLPKAERLVRKYAGYAPYRLTDNPARLRALIRGLAQNWVRHGLPLCPCKQVTGDRVVDRRIVCPCKDHHQEIAEKGQCCCGLFLRKD